MKRLSTLFILLSVFHYGYGQPISFTQIKNLKQFLTVYEVDKAVEHKPVIIIDVPADKVDLLITSSKIFKNGTSTDLESFVKKENGSSGNLKKISIDLRDIVDDVVAGDSCSISFGISESETSQNTIPIRVTDTRTKDRNTLSTLTTPSIAEFTSCNCDDIDQTQSIKKALDFCPNCSDKDMYVYDARCKTFYERVYRRIIQKDGNPDTSRKTVRKEKTGYKYNAIYQPVQNLILNTRKDFKIKVIHVNRYLKDVEISDTDILYQSDAPVLFTNIFGGTGDLMTKLINAQVGSVESSDTSIKGTIRDLKTMIIAFIDILNKYNEIRESVYYQCCEPTATCKDVANISVAELKMQILNIQRKHAELLLKFKNDLANKAQLPAAIQNLKDTIKELQSKNSGDPEILKLDSQIKVSEATFKNIPPDIESLKEEVDTFWSYFNPPADSVLEKMVVFVRDFLKQNYTFSTAPIHPAGIKEKIEIKIDSKDDLPVFAEGLLPTDHQDYVKEAFVKNKWFVNFSSGPFFGIGSKLYANNYEFKKIPFTGNNVTDSSKYMLARSGKTPLPVGIGALANFETKLDAGFGLGGSIGVGLTVEKTPSLNYLLGGSVFFGDEHQFAITGGAAGMQVDVLKKDLYPSYLMYNAPETLKYYKDFRIGGFISITYTFFTITEKANSTHKTNQ